MIDFAVSVKGIHEEDKGSWVLAVDGDRLLIAVPETNELQWHLLSDCTFQKAHTPDQPTMVLTVKGQPQNGKLVFPNRAARRRGE